MENFPSPPPTKKEKIAYLLCKMSGKPFPFINSSTFITTIDIYGKDEPWEIFRKDEPWEIFTGPTDHEYHFFTRLKNVKHATKKPVGKGVWNGYEKIPVLDSGNEPIGFLIKYKYFNKRNANESGKWILEEYTIADKFACCVKDEYADYAFCTVKKVSEGDDDRGVVSDRKIGILEGFFYEMLRENNSASRYPKRFGIDEDIIMTSPK